MRARPRCIASGGRNDLYAMWLSCTRSRAAHQGRRTATRCSKTGRAKLRAPSPPARSGYRHCRASRPTPASCARCCTTCCSMRAMHWPPRPNPLIHIGTRKVGEENHRFVEMTGADNGPGFPERCWPVCSNPMSPHKEKGTGLGLAIVKTHRRGTRRHHTRL